MTEPKSLIEAYSDQVWNAKNIKAVDLLFTENSTIHSPLKTLKGGRAMKGVIEVWLSAFPDLIVDHEAFIAEEDTVVSRWRASGTHKGTFKGIEATGLPISYSGVSIYRLVDGKVTDYWAYVNLHYILEQLKVEANATSIG